MDLAILCQTITQQVMVLRLKNYNNSKFIILGGKKLTRIKPEKTFIRMRANANSGSDRIKSILRFFNQLS